MGNDHSLLAEELGRTQTVQDVERAYQQIHEANRQLAVRLKNGRASYQRRQAEVALFLDDVKHITGLDFKSPLFWKIVGLTLDARLRRAAAQSQVEDSFPNGW